MFDGRSHKMVQNMARLIHSAPLEARWTKGFSFNLLRTIIMGAMYMNRVTVGLGQEESGPSKSGVASVIF